MALLDNVASETPSDVAANTDSEVYNEKIYDLLDSPLPAAPPSTPAPAAASGGGGMFKGLFKNFTTVKRSALSLKADKPAPGAGPGVAAAKVVGGLKEIKVSNAEVRLVTSLFCAV